MKAFLAAASERKRERVRERKREKRQRCVSRSEMGRLHYSASLVFSVTKMNPKGWTQQSNIM